jgi:uncharacterized protein (DUF1499 family)
MLPHQRLQRSLNRNRAHTAPDDRDPRHGETSTRVDLRSASRVGRADFGTNARRIARFLQKLDDRLSSAGPIGG